MMNTATECNNHMSHYMLYKFRKEYEDWLANGGKDNSQFSRILLKSFGGIEIVDSRCVRFLLLVERELWRTGDEFRRLHSNFWDVWGKVAGRILKKDYNIDASYLLDRLRDGFTQNDWVGRQNIFKGFGGCVEQSCGYHIEIMKIIEYVSKYCSAASTGFINQLPISTCTVIEDLIGAQYSIAKKYAEGLLVFKRNNDRKDFLKQLLSSILLSLRLIIRAEESSGFSAKATWPNWRKITLDCLFLGDMFDSGEKIIMSRMRRKALKEFIISIRDICDTENADDLSFLLNEYVETCGEILENCTIKWWGGASKK